MNNLDLLTSVALAAQRNEKILSSHSNFKDLDNRNNDVTNNTLRIHCSESLSDSTDNISVGSNKSNEHTQSMDKEIKSKKKFRSEANRSFTAGSKASDAFNLTSLEPFILFSGYFFFFMRSY